MTNVVQFKWVPPADSDGYRAANADEAAYDVAEAVLHFPLEFSADELRLAEKVCAANRCVRPARLNLLPHTAAAPIYEGGASVLTALELQTLYACRKRVEELSHAAAGALYRCLQGLAGVTGRREFEAAEVVAIDMVLRGETPNPERHRDEVVKEWSRLRANGITREHLMAC